MFVAASVETPPLPDFRKGRKAVCLVVDKAAGYSGVHVGKELGAGLPVPFFTDPSAL